MHHFFSDKPPFTSKHVVKNVQVTSKLSPQNHFITKHILFLKQFNQLS